MSTCGYICPQCEGKGFLDDGEVCDYCGEDSQSKDDLIGHLNKEGSTNPN